MATTNFETGIVIASDWLNDVDAHVYDQESSAHSATNIDFITSGTGAVSQTVQNKLRELVSPIDFGAVGDGVTNDTTALLNALQSGKMVDGGGRSYAVVGTVAPSSFVGLRNATIIQTGDNTSTNFQTLSIVGISNFTIDNVTINMGSNVTTLFSDDSNSGLYVGGTHSGLSTTYIDTFVITGVTVTGNGCGAGIQIRHAKHFSLSNCLVHDRISGSSPDPTNDSQDGYSIVNCSDFSINSCNAYNLKTRLAGIDYVQWTRGFLFVECRDCAVTGCIATDTDQNYDFSGSYSAPDGYTGNVRITVSGCVSNNAGTYGFKFANVTREVIVTGCIANNSGNIGFVCSPSAVDITGFEQYNTQNIDFVGCKVVNTLGTGLAGSTSQGFRCLSNGLYPTYPRAIRFVGCDVIDTQTVITTDTAFASDVTPIQPPDSGYNTNIANQVVTCSCGTGITFVSGIGFNSCSITINSTFSVPNNVYTTVDFTNDESDIDGLHSLVTNNSSIYIKTPGLYLVNFNLVFTANGTGTRAAKVLVNGATRKEYFMAPTSSTKCVVQGMLYVRIDTSGDNIRMEAFQNSGGALDIEGTNSYLSVKKVD